MIRRDARLLGQLARHNGLYAALVSQGTPSAAHYSTATSLSVPRHRQALRCSGSIVLRRLASTSAPSSKAAEELRKASDDSDLKEIDTSRNPKPKNEDQEEIDKRDAEIVKSALGTDQEDDVKKPAPGVVQGVPAASEIKPDTTTTAVDTKPSSKEEKKLTLWEKIKKEAAHYRDGSKLLWFEIKVSFKLALKMAAGHELTRREWRQLKRTVEDLVRLIPFSAFVIVPFAELLLPVALKIFPNMLPSTFEGAKAKEAKSAKLATTRKGVSTFLRKTIQETGLPLSATTKQRDEFVAFFRKVRASGDQPTRDDVIKVCRIFKDDLTLDNLSRPQLVAMSRYMNLSSFGTDGLLRYVIRTRMRQIKRDDKAIAYEGVPSLSVPELHHACQSRGIRTQGVSPGHLRDELKQWLDLRLKHRVPSTLLILSNAFAYNRSATRPDQDSHYEALVATLSSLPDELYHEAELEVSSLEGAATNKQRLDVLREQAELIEEEAEQERNQGKPSNVRDREDLDKLDDPEEAAANAAAENAAEQGAKQSSSSSTAEKQGVPASAPPAQRAPSPPPRP